jgi:beta-1,4-mannosyl-glycoprotein beta-1,4-N-acetylglucosaminyltransferase
MNRKIVDCFIFYNELDLLTYRLELLYDIVDYFVLVESTHTFVGNIKKLYYFDNIEKYQRFNDKIIHVVVTDFIFKPDISKDEQWRNENKQRTRIEYGLQRLNLNDDDLILISDIDEIPNPQVLLQLKVYNSKFDIFALKQDFYYYDLNHKIDMSWFAAVVLPYENYKHNRDPNLYRNHLNMLSYFIDNAGWHLSYFGDEKFISNKIKNFAHQEYNSSEFTSDDIIKKNINECKDLFNRNYQTIKYVNISDNDNLPILYDKYLIKYFNK